MGICKISVVAVLIVMGFSTQAKESGYVYSDCSAWSYGSSEALACPTLYSGATRTCRLVKNNEGWETLLDVWNEEGCAAGVDAENGYCVKNCR